ncbi:hypothetical protein QTH90_21135 [Variovorax sp. J2P1-59]|uniref:hypothetical protein n=1 Tax=Variovorax flavidus TaxID=3053501 RepID=UPI0025773A1C|nr:hypothetical protein [Variovorax sp. J2P1-59]MDM0076927.1 hypothetical protein [Variovorax sp. J2P1-59]
MKKIALVIALCVGAWYFFIGGRKLDEAMVREYYEKEAHAILSRDPELLCKQLSSKAVIQDHTVMMGQAQDATLNRDQACDATRETFKLFENVGSKMGGMLTIEYDFHLDSVQVATDRKSAKVEGTSTLKMGETVMQFRSSFTQELVRELGQMRLLRSDQRSVVRMGGAGAMTQSDFFRK